MQRQDPDEELQHIPRGNDKQNWFRAGYNMIRRHDLAINPETERRDSFRKCLADMKRTFPEFNPIDLDYDVAYFGPLPMDSTKPLDAAAKERLLIISEREKVLCRWEDFAEKNNLRLNWSSNDPIFRATKVVEHKGACTTFPKDRPACPCPECIQECKEKGECFDRVFLAPDRR